MKIGVACGGSGGHIFPGLATAGVLRERGHDVTLWLAGASVEADSLDGWEGPVELVHAAGMPSGWRVGSVVAGIGLIRAAIDCRRRMASKVPDVLLAMGSYASVGPVLAARSRGCRVVLHEANAIPGRALSFLARFCDVVAIAFESAKADLPRDKTVMTGFPVRNTVVTYAGVKVFEDDGFTVLVTGGSQGAHAINDSSSTAICRIHEDGASIRVIHLAGDSDEDTVRSAYEQAGVAHKVQAFTQEMGKMYASADFVIARSGAATCTELALLGIPALLVPLPTSTRGHQKANALALSDSGGVDVVEQEIMTSAWLYDYLLQVMSDKEKLSRMKAALSGVAIPDAAERLASIVECM